MKALLSRAPGGPDMLDVADVPAPEPGPGELLVRVLACGINYPDVLMIEDKYQFRPRRPFSPGCEISGIVERLGDATTGWRVGDRIIAVVPHGGLAEQAIVQADAAHPLPDGLDPLEGAALLFTYGTTIHALADRAGLMPGETLLVLGAAGGVGFSAIETGKAMGARVIAAASSLEKAAAARDAGADDSVVYGRGPFDEEGRRALAQSFKRAVGPGGADVVYDPVGGDYSEAALRSIAWGGRFLVVGFPAGIARLPLNLVLLKGCDVKGVFWGDFTAREPERNRRGIAHLLRWWSAGTIRPRIDQVHSLKQGGEAIARLASRQAIGKVVVDLRAG